ncbi:MAG: tyrosine--tRNA ligase [Candidatus Gracilibacteria bacterium]|nr:tyrosine--tRNA ligase [Candidatus Gracilibacteria bacterium]
MKNLRQELADRGLLFQNSNDKLFELYDKGGELFYCGFDPTADSLHLGNFIGFMVAVHIMRRGNKYIALTGGATGMIGDPGGKDSERTFLSETDLEKNQLAISKQITSIVNNLAEFTGQHFKYDFVNNKDFYKDMGYLDFLREVGKYITVNVMMSKDTVKKRIQDPNQSISYTEFSYMLLQGYDYSKLFIDEGLKLQIGGQDQWGNLVTGTEIIRKKYDAETYALTWPLITDSSGKKFGKSEGNAIWLDKNKTSPYEIYQYFMNTADTDISRYLKMLTLIETEEIDKLVANHEQNPEAREGQKLLAYKVVEIIHGTKEADLALKISDFMFSSDSKVEVLKGLKDNEIDTFQNAMGGFKYVSENFFEIIVKSGLAKSNSEARQSVQSGAITINEQKISDFNYDFSNDFINNKVLLLGKGKKNFRIISK